MIKTKKIFKYVTLFSFLVLIAWLGIISALSTTTEQNKMIDYKETLTEQWVQANYLNSIADIVVNPANNEYIDVISKLKGDVKINPENTYFTQKDYKDEALAFNDTIPNTSISFMHNNWDPLDAKSEVVIWTDYYAANELAPKNPTSVLPIHRSCDRTVEADLSISYSNCETFITTDNQPLFVSYFENGNEYQWWGFTIAEIRNKSDDSLASRFFMWDSKVWDNSLDFVLHKSYTYWVVQTQDRSNLYIPWASGNLNLDWITTTSIDTLANWEYSVYFQNINKFGLKSDKILAWYLHVVPPIWALQDFDFIDITDMNSMITTNIVGWFVSINYKEDARIRINNPGNYEYDILSVIPWITKSWNEFTVDELFEWDNIFNIQIKDEAGNILDNKPLVITVDTLPPVIRQVTLDHSYINQPTTDWAIAMITYLWVDHVNDNIDFSWVNGLYKTPFAITMTDNVSLSWVTTQYSLTASWAYNNVIDFVWTDWAYTFNVDTSFISPDWEATLHFRSIDQFGNISKPKAVIFNINRHAGAPNIITNDWNDIVTNNANIDIKLELDEDIVKVLYDGYNLSDYEPFSTTYTPTLPLQLGEKNYIFNAIDMLWNTSLDWTLNVLKNPSPKEWVYWQDKSIQFEWWVTTNKINLQRVTEDWSAWEVFSR